MAPESRRPPKLSASHPDLERRSGSDDANLVVPADTFDISALRPGWRRGNKSSSSTVPAANPLLVFAPPPPPVPPTASDRNVIPESRWNVGRKGGLITAGTIVLAVVIALPWLLVWSGDGAADGPATQQRVRPAAPPEASPALVAAARVPFEHGLTAPPEVTSRFPAGVLDASPLESEPPAATALAHPTAPPAKDSSVASRRMAPPPAAPTMSAELAAPAITLSAPAVTPSEPTIRPSEPTITPSAPAPAPVDDPVQPGDSRGEPPPPTPVAVSRPPAMAAAPSPGSVAAATDERLVAATLRRFAHAYQQLDANAVAEVWPHADRRVLTRAFDSIESQEVYFEKCDVQIADSGATASCGGWLTYVPKVGKKDPRSISRQWNFALHKGAGEWRITTAAVR
jgi:hypothetical protein